jgi:hypothetical protein
MVSGRIEHEPAFRESSSGLQIKAQANKQIFPCQRDDFEQ